MDYLLIFIPQTLKSSESGYLIGVFNEENEQLTCKSLFIFGLQSNYYPTKTHSQHVIGYYRNKIGSSAINHRRKNFVFINYNNGILVDKVIIDNEEYSLYNCHIIVYDDISLIKSELFLSSNYQPIDESDHFKLLAYHIKQINQTPVNFPLIKVKFVNLVIFILQSALILASRCFNSLSFTTLGIHFHQSLKNLFWLFTTYKKEGKLTLKTGNYLIAVLMDVLCSFMVLTVLIQYKNKTDTFDLIASQTESIIHSIEETIKWLMGSPWGIKLNYPLNYILGNFFLYNIHLWWTFLGLVRPLLEIAFFVFLKIGLFGLSYQIAILADIFSIVSFHVYCIYIYAAKLYNWQISGLCSLSRIFLGRKKNPEPGKVDSCPYTTEQLFVGTICFTVLLFLLPTTLVYYIVFTLMRLGVNIIGGIMTRARYYIQVFPLYCTLAWIFTPEVTSTTMTLSTVNGLSNAGVVTVCANRGNNSWYEVYLRCVPDVIVEPAKVNWKVIGWNILFGKLIYTL